MTAGRVLIEVCVEGPDDAEAAEAGGADRLELCAALDLGGLTPSLGTYLEVKAATRLPVWVMIRPRPGDFVYSAAEVRVMIRDVGRLLPHGPAGFVFGVLGPDGRVDRARAEELVRAAAGTPCAFHRAFDRAPSPGEAVDALADLGFVRLLTSGGEPTAAAGARAIAGVVGLAAGRVGVLPCGRVRAGNVAEVVRATGCSEVHGSFAEPVPVPADRGYRGYPPRTRTSRAEVEAARAALDWLSLNPVPDPG